MLKLGVATTISHTNPEVGTARMTEEDSGGVAHVEGESIQDGQDMMANCLTTEGLVGGTGGGVTITPERQDIQVGSSHPQLKADNHLFLMELGEVFVFKTFFSNLKLFLFHCCVFPKRRVQSVFVFMYIKGNKRLKLWVIFLHAVKYGDKHLLDGANHAPYLSHEKQ